MYIMNLNSTGERMNSQFNYIDRQQSQATGNSEKSHKVHCANWKEEVHLHKELEAFRRQENSAIKSIVSDQKVVANKFRRHVYRSIELIKTHEGLKDKMTSFRNRNNSTYENFQPKYTARPFLFAANGGKSSSMSQNIKDKPNHLMKRPVTASELRVRAWEQRIQTITSKLQRAQSAPALTSNIHSMEPIYNLNCCKTAGRNRSMKYKRAKLNRAEELAKERNAVLNFIEKIKQSN